MTRIIILNQARKLILYLVFFLPLSVSVAFIFVDGAYANPFAVERKVHGIDKNPSFPGSVIVDTLPFKFTVNDRNNVIRNAVTGIWSVSSKGITFSFNDSIVLNYKNWNVSPGNQIVFSPLGILITDLLISNDSARISITTRQNRINHPIDISVQNLNLGDLAGFLNKDSTLISGLVNANIMVSELYKNLPAITGTASVSQMAVMNQVAGDLQITGQKLDEQTVHTTFDLKGNGNEVSAGGNYVLNNTVQQWNILFDIKRLQASILQGFFKNKISVDSGIINSLVTLKGKWKQPEWKGTVNFDSVKFTIADLGTSYSINRQKAILDYPVINLKEFVIKDYVDNSLSVDGLICANSLKEYDLDLKFHSRDFILFNSPKAIDNQLYGFAGTGATIFLTGNTKHPIVNGDIRLNRKTDITLVLPDKNVDKDEAGTVVRFINRRTLGLHQTNLLNKEADTLKKAEKPFKYNLNIAADSSASLDIILDPSTGDELKVKGEARLKAGIDSAQNRIWNGNYRLDTGYYELNYQFQKKRFNVMRGSSINFNGKPINALMDIKAVYIAITTPQELLGNEVGSVSPAIAYSFRQQIPFDVILFLKGSLAQPSISFDIKIKDGIAISDALRRTIENKLTQLRADRAATNKQVFALLVMDRFVGEQSTDFFKGNGSSIGFSDIAKSSVSQFLSAALDEIASDLFKGINVDLNLNSYKDFIVNDGRKKNDLGVEVSKNFLNDRLSVTVGRTYGIESQDGSAKAAQQKGSRFLPDVTVNYKLSKDGKYMLRSYNKDQFEVILDGYVVETGVAFIITMDYDKYKELFMKKNK